MKLPSRSALPPLDSAAWVPLLLAGLLSAALLFQLLAVDDVTLPDAGAVRGGAGAGAIASLPTMDTTTPGGAIVARSMFSPGAARATPGAAASDPLGGVVIAGSVRIGRALYAVVQRPGGARPTYLRPGGRIGGWRLIAITPTNALLRRGGERLTIPFGERSVSNTNAVSGESE